VIEELKYEREVGENLRGQKEDDFEKIQQEEREKVKQSNAQRDQTISPISCQVSGIGKLAAMKSTVYEHYVFVYIFYFKWYYSCLVRNIFF